ncbi:ribonuclease Z [Kushneria phosphatilytica]|uniref:Ribonuclease Z n=1 Tax=Kushneria phosphatilytica TaxID=657387 RepID=A0A1S1NT41_9GAMM|nr:ribonuclease Z [Kushneria phosphatilytica]OHV08755.1 MBL fold metallo-hydrolase [Kushneria phosphatilytica]QEL12476.1 MBL fold metallo-hydrolase [Kushneria phosphatilytica]
MRLRFTGSCAGVPSRQRNVSGLTLQPEHSRRWYLIDCGEGTQHQLMRMSLSLARLEAVLITHVHGDHCYGLPGLLASASMAGRRTPLTLIGPQAVWTFLTAVRETTGLHLDFPLHFIDAATLTESLVLTEFTITAAALSHGIECHGYAFEERGIEASLDTARLEADGVPRGPLWGRLQKGETVYDAQGRQLKGEHYQLMARRPRRLVVSGDNNVPARLTGLCQGADLLVHEATYTEEVIERLGTDNGHCSAARIAAFAEAEGVPNLLLTHFSPRYGRDRRAQNSMAELEREARDRYTGCLALAEDLQPYVLSREGELIIAAA